MQHGSRSDLRDKRPEQRRRRMRSAILLCSVVFAALVLEACGSGDSGKPSTVSSSQSKRLVDDKAKILAAAKAWLSALQTCPQDTSFGGCSDSAYRNAGMAEAMNRYIALVKTLQRQVGGECKARLGQVERTVEAFAKAVEHLHRDSTAMDVIKIQADNLEIKATGSKTKPAAAAARAACYS